MTDFGLRLGYLLAQGHHRSDVQGSNPATINVGDTYTDLGAIVTDNQGHDFSYCTFINGVLSGNILIDTSQVATDTIDYVVTDNAGLRYSKRAQIIRCIAELLEHLGILKGPGGQVAAAAECD